MIPTTSTITVQTLRRKARALGWKTEASNHGRIIHIYKFAYGWSDHIHVYYGENSTMTKVIRSRQEEMKEPWTDLLGYVLNTLEEGIQ